MCGRFTLSVDSPLPVKVRFDIDELDPRRWRPRYNIAPSQEVPVVTALESGGKIIRMLHYYRWGLIPSWAKDEKMAYKMINARAETVHEKPSYKRALAHRRCLVPADSFYEWRQEGKEKIPMRISLRDSPLFGLAGLWEEWRSPAGEVVDSFAIITTTANDFMRPIHDRMPVILAPEDYARWLDPRETDINRVLPLLKPFASDEMEAYAVSKMVNSPKNDQPTVIEPMRLEPSPFI